MLFGRRNVSHFRQTRASATLAGDNSAAMTLININDRCAACAATAMHSHSLDRGVDIQLKNRGLPIHVDFRGLNTSKIEVV